MRKHVQKWMHVCALSFLSKFPRNRCPARLSRVMLNLQPADNSIAPPVPLQSRTCEGCDIAAAIMSEAGLPFQSTHPRGVRLRVSGHVGPRMRSFNPRTRVGCDARLDSLNSAFSNCFNPRTRVGCDELMQMIAPRVMGFNPRTRVGCDSTSSGGTSRVRCFNPRTRVGCDRSQRRTRSPDRGFNPRTRVGCDGGTDLAYPLAVTFQSTHPRGVRRFHGPRRAGGNDVSIHAPAWGATASWTSAWTGPGSFNPRTRVGCDGTPPGTAFRISCFNPRTRVGCDGCGQTGRRQCDVSIHAPAWGATGMLGM